MTTSFELEGQQFVALNGGPQFTFSPAVSFVVYCDTQSEIDEYWNRLLDGDEPQACGWLRDRFGVSWQVVPRSLPRMLGSDNPRQSTLVMQAMLKMQRLEVAALE